MTVGEKLARLKELKDKGHKLLDKVARKQGVHRDFVYVDLQKALGKTLEESAHFSKMFTIREVENAIRELEKMLAAGKKQVTLPLAEQKKLIRGSQKRRPVYVWLPRIHWSRTLLFTLAPKKITHR